MDDGSFGIGRKGTAVVAAAVALGLGVTGAASDLRTGQADSGAGTAERAPDGARLLVVNKSGNSLSVLDPATGEELARVPTGHSPHEVAVSPDGGLAYVTDYGTGQEPGSTVTVVDVEEGAVRDTLSLAPHTRPHGIDVVSDGTFWVTAEGTRHVLHVDPRSGEILRAVETAQEGTHMVVVAEEAGWVFTANIGSGTVTAIDAATGEVRGHLETGAGAEGLALSPDGRRVYVTNRSAGTLSEISVQDSRVLRTLAVGDFPIRVAVLPDGAAALVSNARGNEVARVDLLGWNVAGRLAVGAVPVGIQLSPDGRTAYVANTRANRLSVVDVGGWEVTGTLTAGEEPDGMAWVEGG